MVSDILPAVRAPRAHASIATAVTAVMIGVTIVAAFVLHAFWMLQNHDNDFLMLAARRLLTGGKYVTDVMDPNPPLIMLLLAPPVALAAWSGLEPYTCFSAYVCLLILLSVLLSRPMLLWCFADRPGHGKVLLLCYAAIISLDPAYEFGQREHLFVILFCPGLFWFAARDVGRPSPATPGAVAIVILAALGVMIKPFFLLIPAILLAVRTYRCRSWRVLYDFPVAIFVIAAILYVGAILLVFPDYLTGVAIQRQVYFAWDRAWFTVFHASQTMAAALALAIVLAELAPMPERTRVFARYLSIVAAVCMVMALWEKKAWDYHLLPTIELAECVFALVFAAMLPRFGLRQRIGLPNISVLAAILVAYGVVGLRPVEECFTFARSRFVVQPLIQALQHLPRGTPVLLLTSGYQPGIPSLAGVRLGARAPGQLLLPGIAKLAAGNAADRARAVQIGHLAVNELIEDLQRYKPEIVAVDLRTGRQALPDDFDILGYYESDPDFRQVWTGYHRTESIKGWDLYARRKQD